MQENKPFNNNRTLVRHNDLFDSDTPYLSEVDMDYSQNYYGDTPQENEKNQLMRFLAGLRKHWLLILGFTLIITSLVIVYEAQKPDYYIAETRIQVNNETNPGVGTTSTVIMPGNDPGYFTTQLQILEGSGLLRRVAKETDLENNDSFLRPNKNQKYTVWQNVLRMFGMFKPATEDNETPTVAEKTKKNNLTIEKESNIDSEAEVQKLAPYVSYLQSRLKVTPVKDNRTASRETRLIDIAFTHNDPVVASKLVNSIAETYVLQNIEQKVQTNANAGDFLQKRVAELQGLIRSGEERLINYGKNNQIISLDSNQNTVVQRFADLNAKLGQAENDRIVAQTAYQSALNNPMNSTTVQAKDARTTGLETQLSTLRQQLDQLKLEYTDDWPDVIKVRKQIEGIENELKNSRKVATSTQMATLEQAYREAAARERELRVNFEKQKAEVLAQNEAAINYRIIQQEIDTNKSLLASVLQRSKESDIILNGTTNNVRIVDRSLVPDSPAGPQRSKNVIIAFILSLMAGVGLSFLLTWLNDTVISAEDLESEVGLPVLGLIPATQANFLKRMIPRKLLGNSNGNGTTFTDLEKFENPIINESYLHLRTYLLLSSAGGPPQTVLVTSGQPGEGKTITAINLAKSLAQNGSKVLLIDADLRYPRLHSIIELSNTKGLTSLLTSKGLNQELINEMVQKYPQSDLDILTGGPKSPNPADILGSREMRGLLSELKKNYDHIVIDSPPVLYFADGVIISSFVDAVMVVVRCNQTTRQTILKCKKKLQDVGAKVIGVVFNGIPLKNLKYSNYGYYYNSELQASEDHEVLHLGN